MIPDRPIFKGDGESNNMMDVIPDQVMLLPIDPKYYPKTCLRDPRETIFREVTIEPYQERSEVTELILRPERGYASMEELFELFVLAVERVWDPTKIHLVGHSSGVDSRMLAKAIKILTEKHGDDWVGHVIYVENGGECGLFYRIADVMGFKEAHSYGDGMTPAEMNEAYLDFKDHWSRYNGVVAYPISQWWDGYKQLSLPAENIQGFTGYGANETQTKVIRHRKGYRWYFNWVFHLQLTLFKHWGGIENWHHPFLDWDFLHALQYSDARSNKRIGVPMAAVFVPEVAHIPHIHTKEVTAMGYRTVPEWLLTKCKGEYDKSWFGKKFPVEPNPNIDYNQWWFMYNAASWCEHLLETGHKITIEK